MIELQVAKKWVNSGDQVLGRNREHQKGHGIVGQGSSAWASKEFWSKFIPNEREYRVHIFDSEHIQQGLKCFDPKAKKIRTDDLPIRNTETGWTKFDHTFKPPDGAVRLAKRAVQECGYLWGAVDLLEDASGKCYVLEVNTAPGMDEITARAYADAIKKHVHKAHGY